MPRWVLVDDTDPNIQYSGPWFPDQGSQNNLGHFGQPYLGTLHGTNTNGSFSYSFRGSRVLITGTVEFTTLPDGTANESWVCFVDGVALQSITYTGVNNRLRLCEMDGLSDDGVHVITVKTNVSYQETFWLDYIQYLPFDDVPLDNAAIFIETPDSDMALGRGWGPYYPGLTTSAIEATFNFKFNGISLTWMGFYDNKQVSMAATTASYSIDGQNSTTFPLNGAVAISSGVQFNQIFFNTGRLSPGDHSLDVVYHGDSSKTPLNLYVLIVQNGTSVATSNVTSTTSSNSTPSRTPSQTSHPSNNPDDHLVTHKKGSKGVLIGAILGGLICFVSILGILAYFRRRRQSRRPTSNLDEMTTVDPFILPSYLGGGMPSPSISTADPMRRISPPRASKPSKGNLVSNNMALFINERERQNGSNPSLPSSTPFTHSSSPSSHESRSEPRDEDSGLRHVTLNHILPVTLPPLYTPT